MSILASTLSLNSNKDPVQLRSDERSKLIVLIKAWRSKHDKLHAAAQRHHDVIDTLKNDVERLIEEKETVTNHLTSQLEKERIQSQRMISELRLKAETARNEPEIEARYLREKLDRVQGEIQPIIEFYKDRDRQLEEKISELNNEIEDMKEEKLKSEEKWENKEREYKKEVEDITEENDELKIRYQNKLEEIRKHCALRLANARQHVADESMNEARNMREEFTKKYENIQNECDQQMTEIRHQLEMDHQLKLESMEKEFNKQRHSMSVQHATESRNSTKKIEISNTRLRQTKKENKDYNRLLQDGITKLRYNRTELSSCFFGAVVGGAQTKMTSLAMITMKSLLEQLSMHMRDLREVKRSLERHEENERRHYDVTLQQETFRLELEYNTKMGEIEHVKTLIRKKQIEMNYKTKRDGRQIMTSQEHDGSFCLAENDVRPVTSPGNARQAGIKSQKETPQKKGKKGKKFKVMDSGRGRWLLTRQRSTVQFQPSVNGRQAWLDDEIKRKY